MTSEEIRTLADWLDEVEIGRPQRETDKHRQAAALLRTLAEVQDWAHGTGTHFSDGPRWISGYETAQSELKAVIAKCEERQGREGWHDADRGGGAGEVVDCRDRSS